MFKYGLALFLLSIIAFKSSGQVLDSLRIKNQRINMLITVTQKDLDEYLSQKKDLDTTLNLENYIRIIKHAKASLAYHPSQSYALALENAESGEKMRSRFSVRVIPADISEYMVLRKIEGDTLGKTKDYLWIVRGAKSRMTFDSTKTYEQALVEAENFFKLRNMVDKILVVKSERKMYLQKDGKAIRTYSIALGPNPVGQKEFEGDGKTPEGKYFLDWQKYDSPSFHSFHISYPNQTDIERAKAKGKIPGSNIMVHGTSKGIKKKKDWTNGCIALSNRDMAEFKKIVFLETPIEIRK